MIVECFAIIFVILSISVVFFRAKRANYAWPTLAMGIVPFLHILGTYAGVKIASGMGFDPNLIVIAVDATALIISCLILGLLSGGISSKKSRTSFLLVSGAFLVVLAWLLIANTLRLA